jgi:predicted nucleic acid-binding protein
VRTAYLDASSLIKHYVKEPGFEVLDALSESWRHTLKHHIYAADALQISTAKHAEADLFLTSDKRLNEIAEAEGLKTADDEET